MLTPNDFLELCWHKRVALDCDGVLSDFKAHLLRSVGSPVAPADVVEYEIFDRLGDDAIELAHQLCQMPGWWLRIPAVPGAQAAVRAIEGCSIERVVATSPWWSCKGWESARREYLYEHFAVKSKDVVIVTRKELVHADVLLEDKVENLQAWQRRHPRGIGVLFDQPYNRAAPWPRRLRGWL